MTEPAAALETAAAVAPERRVRPLGRLLLIVLALAVVWAVGYFSGLTESFTPELLRQRVLDAGTLGIAVFIVLFSIGQLLQVPGVVFVAAAAFTWGGVPGTVISWVGAVVAVSVSFVVLRTAGGGVLDALEKPMLARMLKHLYNRPFVVMLAARAAFMSSPLLSSALALSGVRFRDHLSASALGMAPHVAVWSVVLNLVL